MTLKEFLENIDKMVKENPAILDMTVVTSKDDEGNGYNEVYYTPSTGRFEDREFTTEEYYEDELPNDWKPNAICVN